MLQSTKTIVNNTAFLKQSGLGMQHREPCVNYCSPSHYLTVLILQSIIACVLHPSHPSNTSPHLQGEVSKNHTLPFSTDPGHKNTPGTLVLDLKLMGKPYIWCWERLQTEGEGGDRGWDGWKASLTQWTRLWASSRRWWRTGKPGTLQSMGSQRAGHNRATKQQWYIWCVSCPLCPALHWDWPPSAVCTSSKDNICVKTPRRYQGGMAPLLFPVLYMSGPIALSS